MANVTNVKLRLFLLGVTGADIARELKVSDVYVSRCINGKQKPSKRFVETVCRATGLEEDSLFEVSAK